MTQIIELIKAIPWWPITVLVLVVYFRSEIGRAFGRLQHLKYRDFDATFKEELREAEREAKLAIPQVEAGAQSRAGLKLKPTRYDELMRIAEISPRAAIVEAWREVEVAAREAAERHGIIAGGDASRFHTSKIMQELISKGLLPPEFQNVFERLRDLHVQAVHAPDFALALAETERFIQLALGIAVALRSA